MKKSIFIALALLAGCGVSRKELANRMNEQTDMFVRNDMKRIMEISELRDRLSALENAIWPGGSSGGAYSGEYYQSLPQLQRRIEALESKKCEKAPCEHTGMVVNSTPAWTFCIQSHDCNYRFENGKWINNFTLMACPSICDLELIAYSDGRLEWRKPQ